MGIPTTYLSLHDVTDMKATVLQSFDSPLILTVETKYGPVQISLYLRDLDTAKTEFLADVINAAMHSPEPPKEACPKEAAAYGAEGDYYARLKADLDRHPIEKVAI